jgi:hypothetical protein
MKSPIACVGIVLLSTWIGAPFAQAADRPEFVNPWTAVEGDTTDDLALLFRKSNASEKISFRTTLNIGGQKDPGQQVVLSGKFLMSTNVIEPLNETVGLGDFITENQIGFIRGIELTLTRRMPVPYFVSNPPKAAKILVTTSDKAAYESAFYLTRLQRGHVQASFEIGANPRASISLAPGSLKEVLWQGKPMLDDSLTVSAWMDCDTAEMKVCQITDGRMTGPSGTDLRFTSPKFQLVRRGTVAADGFQSRQLERPLR